MDNSSQTGQCKWDRCHYRVGSGAALPTDLYCPLHKRGHRQSRPLPSETSSPAPVSSIASGLSSPTNEKKQLPNKHIARKSTQPHVTPATSHKRKLAKDVSPTGLGAAKKPRLSTAPIGPNGLENHWKPNRSSSSENRTHPSQTGTFRPHEEGTLKLSAVDEFALRPKNRERPKPSGSKFYNDQRRTNGQNEIPATMVIDLTGECDSGVPELSSRSTPLSPAGASTNPTQARRPPQRRPFPSIQNGPPIEYITRSPNPEKFMESVLLSPTSSKPISESDFQEVTNDQKSTRSTPRERDLPSGDSTVPRHRIPARLQQFPVTQKNSAPFNPDPDPDSDASELDLIAIKNTTKSIPQVAITTDREKKAQASAKLNGGDTWCHIDRKETTEEDRVHMATLVIAPTHPAPTSTVSHLGSPSAPAPAPGIPINLPKSTSIPAPVRSKSLSTDADTPGRLAALLGGREWKKMTPEDRRRFWVSQHDPDKFDAQIYSENNRPFRPGDSLFGLPEDTQPPRPTRPAKYFEHLDARIHYSFQMADDWYQKKQANISARGNKKETLQKVPERAAANRILSTPRLSKQQELKSLPQRVQQNPKWVAGLELLKRFEAQDQEMQTGKKAAQKQKAKQRNRVIHDERGW